MKGLAQRAVFVSLVPFGIAVTAYCVRESTRVVASPKPSGVKVTEITPPPMFLLSLAAKHSDRSLRVGPQSSGHALRLVGGEERADPLLRVEGRVRILADGTIEQLDLQLVRRFATSMDSARSQFGIALLDGDHRSRATSVPGVQVCDMRCALTRGGKTQETTFAASWIRIPGGTVQFHAVAPFTEESDSAPWSQRLLASTPTGTLGVDLVLIADD